ncbi:MAG: hypothetical protein QE267_00160 [Akkermansiaceae bacterium]|nr:hypothetical protein [Akkermansiaceae bacterium]
MKFPRIALTVCLVAGLGASMAAPPAKPSATPPPSLDALIDDLSADAFQTREEATRKLWAIGEPAVQALRKCAIGEDPEKAYRARDLIRKIELSLTPDTDPAILSLTERYEKAAPNDKITIFDQLRKRRAWPQILNLYAKETSAEVQARLEQSVSNISVIAAREALIAANPSAARKLLESAPATAAGLLTLADFHHRQGSLNAELKLSTASAWKLALYRASGNLTAARDAAQDAGEPKIAASMACLLGDPIPWLQGEPVGSNALEVRQAYANLAIARWQGKPIRPDDLATLTLPAQSKSRPDSDHAIHALFLLGAIAPAEAAYTKKSALEAFAYFEALERIPEALNAFGIDPQNPDFNRWVEKRIGHLAKGDAEDEHDVSTAAPELIALANFMEHRGLSQAAIDAFQKPLLALATSEPKVFNEFLGDLFGGTERVNGASLGAPELAKSIAIAWAADDAARWDEILDFAFGSADEIRGLWKELATIASDADQTEKLDAMLALTGMGPDPHRLREKWLARIWEAVAQTPKEQRKPLLEQLAILLSVNGDVANNLKLWGQISSTDPSKIYWPTHIFDLSAAERWSEASDFFIQQITRISESKQAPQLYLYAGAASSLRKAGRTREAANLDALVNTLALGQDAAQIANGYAFGHDFKRAADWWQKAAIQADPDSDDFAIILQSYSESLFENARWKEASAVNEVIALESTGFDSVGALPITSLRVRLHADLGRALTNLKSDRARSIEILQNCHGLLPSDGSLADYFFPALRQSGLTKEHDAWFQQSWEQITSVIRRYPKSENTYNTAAWLASRARLRLDEAAQFLDIALTLNPNQPAYLDTMAEVQFARRNRKAALESSTQAVNFMPLDGMIRRQHERFRTQSPPR